MEKRNTCAVVLAGGFGTRLSPLTDSVPKPLMRVLDKTVLELTVEKLKELGIKDIRISAFYKWQAIKKQMEKYDGVRVFHEAVPLGTAGGAKMCLDGEEKDVLVLSGDGIFDFDLRKVVDYFYNEKANAVIVTTHNSNPTKFGTVLRDTEGNVTCFVEKPAWKNVVTNVVNTGIYMLSARTVREIPDGIAYDFAANLFPKLIKSGATVKCITLDGYWCDIGSHEEYLKCNLDACFGKIKTVPNTRQAKNSLLSVGICAKDEVFLGENVTFGSNVTIEKGLVACGDCHVESNCTLSGSVLGKNVKIGRGSGVFGAIIADGVTVGENCIIAEGCVIESESNISEGTVLEKNTSVSRRGEKMDNSGMKNKEMLFVDDGKAYFTGGNVADKVEKFGLCLARAMKEENGRCSICVIGDGCGNEIKERFMKGCKDAGATVLNAADAKEYHFVFASIFIPSDLTVCITQNENGAFVKCICHASSKLDTKLERKTSKMFYSAPTEKFPRERGGEISVIPCVEELYRLVLYRCVKLMRGKEDSALTDTLFFAQNDQRAQAILWALTTSNENNQNIEAQQKLRITFTSDGFTVKSGKVSVDLNHALAAVIMYAEHIGISRVYLDDESPEVYRYILQRTGRYFEYIDKALETGGFDNMFSLMVCRDMNFCLCALLCIMSVTGKSLEEIMKAVPAFEVYSDMYLGYRDRAASMEKLCCLYKSFDRRGSGVTVKMSRGNVTVIPDRVRGFKIISEAASMETAREMCMGMAKAIDTKDGE